MVRISNTIKNDHRELEKCYDVIVNSTDPDEQTRYQNQFTWELARHSIGEELVVYPAFEQYCRNGKSIADKDRDEHQVVKEKLKLFQDMNTSDPKFIPMIKSLMSNLSEHMKEEEQEDLVALESAISADQSNALSTSFERTKVFVPSRSHPSAPNRPPFETAVGLLTAPIDHIADIFRKFPHESSSK